MAPVSVLEKPVEKVNQRYRDEFLTRKAEQFSDVIYDNNGVLKDIRRITDSEMQGQGIDMIFEHNGSTYFVDEKAAVNYRFRDLQTFSFELASQNNKDGNGWFINKDIMTTHYMLQWYHSPIPAELDEKNIPRYDREKRQEIRNALKDYADKENFDALSSYEIVLIPKKAILDMLKNDGIVPQDVLEKFKQSFENPERLTDWNCSIDYDDDGNPKRYRMSLCGGKYAVVQSLNLKEKPINIIIPKVELMRVAEMAFGEGDYNIDVNRAIADFEKKHQSEPLDLSKIIKPKTIEALESKNLITGALYIDTGSSVKQGRMKPQNGMRLTLGGARDDPNNIIAEYRASDKKWVLFNDTFPVRNNQNFVSYKDELIAKLNRGEVPKDFRVMDKYHNSIERTRLSAPQHGDTVEYNGEKTLGQKIELTYNKYAQAWIMANNNYLAKDAIKMFNNYPVVSQHDWDMKKAVAQRLISECVPLRNQTLDSVVYVGPEKTPTSFVKHLAQSIEKIQQEGFKKDRYSEEEIVFQKAPAEEKKQMFSEMSSPFYVKELADTLMHLSYDERIKSGQLASIIYSQELIDRARNTQAFAEQRMRAEKERLEIEAQRRAEAARAAAARRAAFANPISVQEIALKNGAPTFIQERRSPYSHSIKTEFVSWTKDTIQSVAQELSKQVSPQQPCCLSSAIQPFGQVPPYAMAAISNLLPDRQVYIETKKNDPVEICPRPVTPPNANGELESHGIKFKVIESKSAVEIQWQLSDESKRYYHPSDLRNLELPAISPGKEVYIKNVGLNKLPYGSDFVNAIIGTTYSPQNDVFSYNGHIRGYNCIASRNLETIGVSRTENDLQCLRTEDISMGRMQQKGDIVIGEKIGNNINQNKNDVQRDELEVVTLGNR